MRDKWTPKPRACSSLSFTSRGMFTNNSFWQARQRIPNTTVTFYSNFVKNMRRLLPETLETKELTAASQYTFPKLPPSHRNFLVKNNITVAPTHSTFLCFPDWWYSWKVAILAQLRWSRQSRRRCWTFLKNMTSRLCLQNGRSAVKVPYAWNETSSRVVVASRSEVSFWPDDSRSLENYG
jgi:hypothetical protein